jgi:hypothetical protein
MVAKRNHLKAVSNIDVIVANMQQAFMECRDWGHSWRPYTVGVDRVHNVFEETLRCSRCMSRRHRTISGISGSVFKTRYTYRANYLVPGWGRMSKDDKGVLRIAVLEQMVKTHGTEIEVVEVG